MTFRHKIAVLMILAAIQFPFTGFAAEEDRELAPIAAEQPRTNEKIGEINPALTEKISTEKAHETNKDVQKRKKKLKQTRKEKESENERRLKENERRLKANAKSQPQVKPNDDIVIIDPNAPIPDPVPEPVTPQPQPQVQPQPAQSQPQPQTQTQTQQQFQQQVQQQLQPPSTPTVAETATLTNQQQLYTNFTEVARAVHFVPLYMPRKSGYEITAVYASQGVAEIRYGRRWEPRVSLTVRTYKRAEGEELKDISGVTDVKWRIDTTTGTTIYIAKISDTQQVAAWAVGHYTFSARAENLSFAGFHSLVADELVELSTHYYLDL